MKYLRGFDFVLAAFGLTMLVTLGVVSLMYGVYLDESPHMREEFPALLKVTALFGVLTVTAGLAYWALRRGGRWVWPAQGLLLVAVMGIAYTLKAILTA